MKKKLYIYGTERPCIICGKLFRPRDKNSPSQCCSNNCRGKLQTQKALRICPVCGVQFIPSQPKYKACSHLCAATLRYKNHVPDPIVEINKK